MMKKSNKASITNYAKSLPLFDRLLIKLAVIILNKLNKRTKKFNIYNSWVFYYVPPEKKAKKAATLKVIRNEKE